MASLFQTTFNRRTKRSIVVNYIHAPPQEFSPHHFTLAKFKLSSFEYCVLIGIKYEYPKSLGVKNGLGGPEMRLSQFPRKANIS